MKTIVKHRPAQSDSHHCRPFIRIVEEDQSLVGFQLVCLNGVDQEFIFDAKQACASALTMSMSIMTFQNVSGALVARLVRSNAETIYDN